MPLTDSMEKPPAMRRTAGPIAVFSNSYAHLPERFFARLSPTPDTKSAPDQVQQIAGLRTGRRYTRTRTGRAGGGAGNVRPPKPSRSRWPMPGINSAISLPRLATAAQSPWRGLGPNAPIRRFSEGRRAEHRSRTAGAAELHWGRSCANIPLAKRYERSEFRPRGRWR